MMGYSEYLMDDGGQWIIPPRVRDILPLTFETNVISGWWFGTMEFYGFPYVGKNNPNWRTHSIIFQRGGEKPPSSYCWVQFSGMQPMSFLTCVNRDFWIAWARVSSVKSSRTASFVVRLWLGTGTHGRRDQMEVMYVNVVDPTTRNIS